MNEIMPEMHELVGLLENADYTSLDKDKYKKLHNALQIGAEKVTDLADYFVRRHRWLMICIQYYSQADILSVR